MVSPMESEDDSMRCDAILATRSELGEEETMKADTKDAFEQALEELHVGVVRGEMVVGNRRGLNLAGLSTRVRILEDEVAGQKEKATLQKEKTTLQEAEIAELKDQVLTLRLSMKEYRRVRNWFISTFKRDKLNNADGSDIKSIQEGNVTAHGGDAIVNALLYKGPDGRRDASAFEKLYGLNPLRVLAIKHKPTIAVMNTHAGIISSQYKVGSEKFYKTFAEFIKLLKDSDFDESYLDDGELDSLTRVYWSFLKCAKDEVRSVD
ncbi:hypothetical protein RUND412_001861 [Rhizina undulata]